VIEVLVAEHDDEAPDAVGLERLAEEPGVLGRHVRVVDERLVAVDDRVAGDSQRQGPVVDPVRVVADDERLGPAADEYLTDGANEVLLSAAVVWEVAIKRALGKLEVPDDFAGTLLGAGAVGLPVTLQHASAMADLPSHHRDPFDRMLIAQARLENAVLVTHDEGLRPYGVPMAW
jgi:PIN domain nuclease of toxin-antitoxin system